MTQPRQSKGTPIGGQFAEGRRPEGGELMTKCNNGFSDDHEYDESHRCGWCGAYEPGFEIRREVEIDTHIAAAYAVVIKKKQLLGVAVDRFQYMLPSSMKTHDSHYMLVNGEYEVLTVHRIRTMFEAGEIPLTNHRFGNEEWGKAFKKYDDAREELGVARSIYQEEEKKYEGWSRFFLVQGGHIHSSLNCSTCNKDGKATSFGWLPDLSGLSEKDAVDAHGAVLCTVCYPSAPVEYTNQFELDEATKLAARCEGSGKYVESNGGRRYAKCPVCNSTEARTSSGKIRAHKRPEKSSVT